MPLGSTTRFVLPTVLQHAATTPDRIYTRLVTKRGPAAQQTWGELAAAAERAAGFLHARGLRSGQSLVLLGTHHIDLPAVWLGSVWLGAIPTILAEPNVRIDREVYWSRLGQLLQRIDAWGIAADPRIRTTGVPLPPHYLSLAEVAAGTEPAPRPIPPQPTDTLLLQHSSGTTGLQKGVMLSHAAISHHADAYNARLGMTPTDVVASWLPLYHDMGFIGCFIMPLIFGATVAWLSPFEWVANPGLLLEAVTTERATLSWLPNFAFQFLTARVKPEPGRYRLESLRAVVNCSEPVTAEAIQAFCRRFAADGLSAAAVQTCYAMAENVFAVTTTDAETRPRQHFYHRVRWRENHIAEAVPTDSPNAAVHVSNGRCVPHCDVRIAAADGTEQPPLASGEILIRSPFLFSGYYRRDDLNGNLFSSNGFYNTGDVGYLDEDGHLYVTGRKKDLIILGGRNFYPQDVERVVEEIPGVHPGRVVCFGVNLHSLGTEGLVVLLEADRSDAEWPDLLTTIRTQIPARLDADLFDVRIVPRGELRKSSAGKLARSGNREWYLAGRFGPISPDVFSE